MPHYKCVGCRLRLQTGSGPVNDVGDPCPACGTPLEPVADLAGLMGYRFFVAPPAEDVPLPNVQTVALPLPGTEL